MGLAPRRYMDFSLSLLSLWPLPVSQLLEAMNHDERLDVLIETIELLVPIAKAIPALGQTVEGALEAAIKVIKFAKVNLRGCLSRPSLWYARILSQSVDTNKESTRELASEAARWTEALVKALTAAPPVMLPDLIAHVEEMTKCVLCILPSMPGLTDG
jgi:hypothetical protein